MRTSGSTDGRTPIFIAFAIALVGLALARPPVAHAQNPRMEKAISEIEQFQALRDSGKFKEAEAAIKTLVEKYRQAGDPGLEYFFMSSQANFYLTQGRYPEALPLAETTVRGCLETWGPNHPVTVGALSHLGEAYSKLNRLEDALAIYRRARKAAVIARGPDHDSVNNLDANIASDLAHLGRFQEAEPIAQKVLAWEQRHSGGKPTEDVAVALCNLARIYYKQSRFADAEKQLLAAIAIFERLQKGDRTRYAQALNLLGDVYQKTDRFAAAEQRYQQSHAIYVQLLGPDHPLSAVQDDLVDVYQSTNRLDEAEKLLNQALAFSNKYYGPDSTQTFDLHTKLYFLTMRQGKLNEADKVSKLQLSQAEQPGFPPHVLVSALKRRSLLVRQLGRTDEACALAARLVELEEQSRAGRSGGEQQLSESMASAKWSYDFAADCYLEAQNFTEAFAVCERGRSRTLLDQMALGNVDLFSGMAPERAAKLRSIYQEIQTGTADLAAKIAALEARTDLPAEAKQQQLAKLDAEWKTARRNLAEAYAYIRNESPAFRRVVGQHFAGVSLADFQSYLQRERALALYYVTSGSHCDLFVIDGKERQAIRLEIDDEQSRILEVTTDDELSGKSIGRMLTNDAKSGVLQLISDPKSGSAPTPKLAALGKVLLPTQVLEKIEHGNYQRLIIVPDGPLAMLPFEALVIKAETEEAGAPRYLIEVSPPICYAPSATTLITLADRAQVSLPPNRDPVLALGDPAYGAEAVAVRTPTSKDPFRSRGGRLTPLPNSGVEARWVAEIFARHGMPADVLRGRDATEAAVRANAPNRRIVHLACHGLADDEHGNFFGALALAPGAGDGRNPKDDGFLNLNEIYELDLRACDLALLSACQTNYGPRHEGEGIWSLARGFLVAGSRRVIASNWLVDDRAGASLISYYCGSLTKQPTEEIDYARALTDAKRWTLEQREWAHPYYWATFVLIGPR